MGWCQVPRRFPEVRRRGPCQFEVRHHERSQRRVRKPAHECVPHSRDQSKCGFNLFRDDRRRRGQDGAIATSLKEQLAVRRNSSTISHGRPAVSCLQWPSFTEVPQRKVRRFHPKLPVSGHHLHAGERSHARAIV